MYCDRPRGRANYYRRHKETAGGSAGNMHARPSHRAAGQLRLFNGGAELHAHRNEALSRFLDASLGLSDAGLRHRSSQSLAETAATTASSRSNPNRAFAPLLRYRPQTSGRGAFALQHSSLVRMGPHCDLCS
jgi:hypothetical protein